MKRPRGKSPCEPAMKVDGLDWQDAMKALLNAQPPNAETQPASDSVTNTPTEGDEVLPQPTKNDSDTS